MKQKLLGTALASLLLAAPLAHSAEFICQDDVKPASYSPEEQRLVDQFWEESLTYLGQYLRALETPTGECKDSAEATIQTYDAATGAKQTRCIMRYRDIELLANARRQLPWPVDVNYPGRWKRGMSGSAFRL